MPLFLGSCRVRPQPRSPTRCIFFFVIWVSINSRSSSSSKGISNPALSFFFDSEFPYDEGAVAKALKNVEALSLLAALKEGWASAESWEEAKGLIGETAKAQGSKPGKLMFPTRVALSGLGGGIDLGVIISSLGQEQCVARLERFLSTQQG